MAWNAQSDAKGRIKKAGLVSLARYEFLPQSFEGSRMVSVQVYSFALTFLAMCAAILAGILIAQEDFVSPFNVWLRLAQNFLLCGYATFPVMGLFSSSETGSFRLSDQVFRSREVVMRDEFRNADATRVHVGTNGNRSPASTLAKVLTLVGLHPQVYAAIVCAAVISGVFASFGPTFHATQCIKFNKRIASKWGELLETRPGDAEGNQQPSAANGEVAVVAVKVQRLAGEEPTNKPALAPHAKAMI